MKIRVRLFAQQAHEAATSALVLDLPGGATVADGVQQVREKYPAIPWPDHTLVAVNQHYAAMEQPLHADDELAIIPPVSGG